MRFSWSRVYSEIKVVIVKENAANAEIRLEVEKPSTSGRISAFSGHFPTLHCKIILPSTWSTCVASPRHPYMSRTGFTMPFSRCYPCNIEYSIEAYRLPTLQTLQLDRSIRHPSVATLPRWLYDRHKSKTHLSMWIWWCSLSDAQSSFHSPN